MAAAEGQRDNQTMKHLIAIARFFGVPPTYFFPDDAMQQDPAPPELAAALIDDKVREIALRAAGLSDRSLKAITDMIDSVHGPGLPYHHLRAVRHGDRRRFR